MTAYKGLERKPMRLQCRDRKVRKQSKHVGINIRRIAL